MSGPLISICIPAYRAEKFLPETLASVAAQTWQEWELIVTEDGSRDRAEEIVNAFAKTVSQTVVYNRHPHNRGLSPTRNTGMAAARGTWIAFLDADDLWMPGHLAALVAAAREDSDLVYAGSVWFDNEPSKPMRTVVPDAVERRNLPAALFKGDVAIQPSSAMVRRTTAEKVGGFSAEHPVCNDLEYWLRILRSGGRATYSETDTCLYRRHPDNMTAPARDQKQTVDVAEVCAKYHDWSAIPFPLSHVRPAHMFYWAGRMAMRHDPAAAHKLLARSVRFNPLNPKALLYWFKTGRNATSS